MSTTRYFSGARELGKKNPASEIMRIEIQKKGKLSPQQRYKMLMKKRFEENKNKAFDKLPQVGFSLPGSIKDVRKMSKRAELALKEIAAKKAAKEAKALRKMVIVQRKVLPNGVINTNGKIVDIEGNVVAKINTKNGKMSTTGIGMPLGKYKPRSVQTILTIQEAIDKYSPFYINLRRQQMLQQQAAAALALMQGQEVLNLYGGGGSAANAGPESYQFSNYGTDVAGPRQNIGVTSWGARSDNVWGTFADNIWGGSADNVWGTASTNVWGGLGGNIFAGKAVQFWGTGNGRNYLRGVTKFFAAIFGIKSKNAKEFLRARRDSARTARLGGRSSSAVARTAVRTSK